MKLHFLGATRQVTGSRYLLEAGGLRLLFDCGMFQERAYLGRNWEPSPVHPREIDDLLLTHAHVDHSGLVPRLVRAGFDKPILATGASIDLTRIILNDSARIQAEDAAFKKKRHRREKRKGKYPPAPLYRPADVAAAIKLFRRVRYNEPIALSDAITVTFRDAGHILGSAMIEVSVARNGQARTVVFSGDLGQPDKPIINDPSTIERADFLVMESTYGGRNHRDAGPIADQLEAVINETVEAGGNLLIPIFAVERAQELIYYLAELAREDRIPHLLTFLDSPMAVNVTRVFRAHPQCMDDEAKELLRRGKTILRFPGFKLIRRTHESKAINRIKGSCIIMAGSGMCTAGRIKHHLVKNIARPECTVLFCGYQASGTLGRQLVDGRDAVRIHGAQHPVRAKIRQIHGFSGHADQEDLLRWLQAIPTPPRRIFLTHGELDEAEALAGAIRKKFRYDVEIPEYQAVRELE